MALTAVTVQHVRQQFARATDVVVDGEDVLRERIAMQAQHKQMKKFSKLVRQTSEHVMAQMKLSAIKNGMIN